MQGHHGYEYVCEEITRVVLKLLHASSRVYFGNNGLNCRVKKFLPNLINSESDAEPQNELDVTDEDNEPAVM
jgi:hypothetical protein